MIRISRSRLLRQFSLGLCGVILVTAIAACSGTGGNSTGAAGAGDNVLTVGSDAAYPPFESQSASGDFEGFDIDLFRAIGEASGLEIEFQNMTFDGLIPALQSSTIDAAVSAMTITPERAKTVDFSRPYFKAGLAIAVQDADESVKSLADLKGKKIAVQIGTTGADKAAEIEGAKISTFETAPLALQELSNKNVDAVINDLPVTLDAINTGNVKGLKVVGELLTEEYYGIATPKGSANLEKINAGLNTIIENGTYATIYQKWFGKEPEPLPEQAL